MVLNFNVDEWFYIKSAHLVQMIFIGKSVETKHAHIFRCRKKL